MPNAKAMWGTTWEELCGPPESLAASNRACGKRLGVVARIGREESRVQKSVARSRAAEAGKCGILAQMLRVTRMKLGFSFIIRPGSIGGGEAGRARTLRV